jgi:hypothetical protein
MSEHDWCRENLDLYLAGGLAPDESLHLERHAAECAACAQELARGRLLDRELDRLCAPVHFSGDWDQRVQARWHKTNKPRRSRDLVRWAAAAAALLLVGGLGGVVSAMMQQGMVAFPGADMVGAGLFQRGPAEEGVSLRELERAKAEPAQVNESVQRIPVTADDSDVLEDLDAFKTSRGRPNIIGEGKSSEFYPPAPGLIVRDGRSHTPVTGGIIGGKSKSVPGSVTFSDAVGIRDGTADAPAKRLAGLQQLGDMKEDAALNFRSNDSAKASGKEAQAARAGAPPSVERAKGSTYFGLSGATASQPAEPKAAEATPSDLAARTADKAEKVSDDTLATFLPGTTSLNIRDVERLQKLQQKKQDLKREETQALKKQLQEGRTEDLAAATGAQPKPEPQGAQRKIIRTGELEFEVNVFDDTVAKITRLIGAIPGAFVATVNSDKLPNGKVKGSVVVRVPPESLDKFVLDLRKALAKVSELKSQKIGSADVTKQYTDIESRLRAARAMEERILAIIKNGKAEVKDLIAAERELGTWRTKIEEMEGEIRYYNNQIGLSTLTITAYEKEIRAAASMVVTEHVTMKIEADDVEKSLQAALLAVTAAKGRVTKSDLKQHAAGQLEAVLSFEVAPAQADAVKDKLKGLGNVTHQDAQRLQQAEGGTAPLGEIKSHTNDVHFHVTLYNVANIQPREAYVLQIVVPDVPGDYKKLLDGVTAAKGQVRVSQLDEKDKTNTFAQLDFDVPSTQRELFDKVLAGLGDVVSRNTTRAGPGESATDRKVGYRLTLKSESSVPPRETFTLTVYSLDVPATYSKLQDAAARLKGTVRALQLNEQDKNNITAQFDVDLPRSDTAALEKLLDDAGEVASRTTSRVPPNEIATDRKVGYRLTLRSQIPPRETLDLNIEVADVDGAAATLTALVKSAKGRVTASEVTQDAAGKSVAIALFDVPLLAKDELAAKFKAIGKVRGQKAAQNLQAPDGKLATAHINVRLTNVTPIVPSDEGLWPQVRRSLGYAFTLLSVSLMFVIVGLSVLLPWALIVWLGVKLVRRLRARGQAEA